VQRRVSMADVAAAAGVSGQTVSRVVNGSPRVDPDTRTRIETAMADLGYRPHRAARALRTGRSGTIGVIVATLATVGNSRMLEAVATAAADRELAVTLIALADRAEIAAAFERLHDLGVDGAIVLNEATAIAEGITPPEGLALVAVDSPGAAFPTVQSDHFGGAEAATRRLLDAGRRVVAHLAGPEGSYAAAERERGWRAAHDGTPATPPLRGDWTAVSGHEAGIVLAAQPEVDAVFAANDQMALGVLRALADAGRDDVAVIGFDDVADAADYRPPLTTVRQDFAALGEAAVAALAATLDGAAPSRTVVPTTLIARASG
jgi:DNA-binding LacI/PurR family transcriptional regulator